MHGPTALRVAPFDERWIDSAFHVIEAAASETGLVPLVLLPDDIQRDEYETRFETVHAGEACVLLEALATPGAEARLIFCDLSPFVVPDDAGVLAVMLRRMLRRGWELPSHLIVCTPQTDAIPAECFDQRSLRFAACV